MELNVIGQGGPRAFVGGTHTQSIIDGSKGIIHSDFITQIITEHSQMSLKGDYFLFDMEETLTLMLTSFVQAFLTRNRNIHTTSILGARRTNHSRTFFPGMHEDIFGGDNVRSTVRNDVRIADKLDTTVEAFTTDKRNTAPSRIVECSPKTIFVKEIKEFDSSSKMNLANSVPVKTPYLVSFSDLPVNTDNVTDRRSGGVATSIVDKDRIWSPKPSDIGTAVTHDEIKNISEKLAFSKYLKELEFETIKILQQDHEAQEHMKEIVTRLSMT